MLMPNDRFVFSRRSDNKVGRVVALIALSPHARTMMQRIKHGDGHSGAAAASSRVRSRSPVRRHHSHGGNGASAPSYIDAGDHKPPPRSHHHPDHHRRVAGGGGHGNHGHGGHGAGGASSSTDPIMTSSVIMTMLEGSRDTDEWWCMRRKLVFACAYINTKYDV